MTDESSHNHKLYIETVGCQMNMLDSELVVAALRQEGYELTDSSFTVLSLEEYLELQ